MRGQFQRVDVFAILTIVVRLSTFGHTFGGPTGIMDLMDDMGRALAGDEKQYMLGGGNPAKIPAVEALWRARLTELLDQGDEVERMLGNYGPPQGHPAFIEALAELLNRQFGWDLTPRNVAITNGSQTAFFLLLNMLSGVDAPHHGGSRRHILFPILPEYIGYADQGLTPGCFAACRPIVDRLDEHTHKYRVDFDAVVRRLDDGRTGRAEAIGAMCVSRPTNPSGNVLTDAEVRRLDELARHYEVPLIVDNAYGAPFPNIVFDDVTDGPAGPIWNENIVLGMSLSKIGLPGVRTGIIVASSDIITALSRANAVLSLANTAVGQVLTEPLVRSGAILSVAREVIRPFYRARAEEARRVLYEAFDNDVAFSVHRVEGSIFLWLWLPELPISSRELYDRLKRRNVLVVPGEYFFFGDRRDDRWNHARRCIRINYGQQRSDVAAGLGIIADEVKSLCR